MKIASRAVPPVLFAAMFALAIANVTCLNVAAQAQSHESADPLVGVWEGDGPSDARARQHTVLELRADHTYTKTLRASVDGVDYGGTHSGTWTARGMTVDLSGDGHYPASTQDLRALQKVK